MDKKKRYGYSNCDQHSSADMKYLLASFPFMHSIADSPACW